MRLNSQLTVFALLVHTLLSINCNAQRLAFTLKTNGSSTATGVASSVPGEVLQFEAGEGTSHCLSEGAIALLVGDTDGNGTYDDGPVGINALTSPPGTTAGSSGFWMSFRTSTTFLNGTTVLDGDVVQMEGPGAVTVIYPESLFEQITATTGIDIDALHVEDNGQILFSFADDELTSSNWLIQQNGGNPTLDECTLFRWTPGAQEAAVYLNRAALIALVNNAMGLNLSTVVDLTGVTRDSTSSGELLFTTGSANNAIEGWIFSTAGAGSVAAFSGQSLNPTAFGFDELERLEALSMVPSEVPRLSLHINSPIPTGAGAIASAWVIGATPFADVYLLASELGFPIPSHQTLPSLFGAAAFLNLYDQLLMLSLVSPLFRQQADAFGRADFTFATPFLPSGLHIVGQAWNPGAAILSWPFTVDI